jgi:TetR/AcrR family transcriptional repressor of nem operon
MSNRTNQNTGPAETKLKLLDAGITLMRSRGYSATTVDEICAEAGVTKGAFFHYFKSKDDLARNSLNHFFEGKVQDYNEAPFRKLPDPLERVFGRLDYLKETGGDRSHVTKGCLIGVFAQELAFTNPGLRDICQQFFSRIAQDFARDLAAAKAAHPAAVEFDPLAVAQSYVALMQGSLLMAKTAGNNEVVRQNVDQYATYLKFLFGQAPGKLAASAADKSSN